jgi:hypothetical protein
MSCSRASRGPPRFTRSWSACAAECEPLDQAAAPVCGSGPRRSRRYRFVPPYEADAIAACRVYLVLDSLCTNRAAVAPGGPPCTQDRLVHPVRLQP